MLPVHLETSPPAVSKRPKASGPGAFNKRKTPGFPGVSLLVRGETSYSPPPSPPKLLMKNTPMK